MGVLLPHARTLSQAPQLAISESEDDPEIREKYRPFLLEPEVEKTDWVSELELETAMGMVEDDLRKTGQRLRVLVLYGSLRTRFVSLSIAQIS
jgi:arsenic resistance protein ArsH